MKTTKLLLALAGGAATAYAGMRAVQAWRYTRGEQPAPSKDPHAYGRMQRRLMVYGIARSAATSFAFAYGPAAPALERALAPVPGWLRPGAFFAAGALGGAAVDLGIAIVEDHALEHRFGLSEQPLRAFLIDYAKSALLGAGVAGVLGVLGGLALEKTGRRWWIVAALGTLPLYVLANVIVPLYVMPLFNAFEPLEGPLETQLRALASRYGVGDAEILRMDMSRQTKKANAFVAGLGSTHRIVLGDTLIDQFQPDEIEFVVAHELGHYVSRDTWRLVAFAEVLTAVLLAFTAARIDGDESAPSVRLARIGAWLGAGMTASRPIVSAFSRSREWAADRFAIGASVDARAGARAFRRLRDQNLAEEEPPLWYELLFASHPSLGKRIAALEPSA